MKTYLQEKLTQDQMAVVNGTSAAYITYDQKGAGNGVATLDVSGKVTASQLPDNIGEIDDVTINNTSIVESRIAKIIYETGLGSDSSNAATVTAIRSFVNSSINAIAAYYITANAQGDPFATKAALTGAVAYYYAGSTRVPTKNDYAIVVTDETHSNMSARYVYTESGNVGQWAFQYTFNMQFTDAQVSALNSGINSAKVALYDVHLASTGNPHSVTKSQVGLGSVPNVTTNNQTPTFSEASTRANINSGETLATLFGKIKKWFSSLGTMAFETAANYLKTTDISSWAKAATKPAYTAGEISYNTVSDVGSELNTMGTLLGQKIPNTRKINGKALSGDVTLNGDDMKIGTIVAQTAFTAITANDDMNVAFSKINALSDVVDTKQTAAQVTAYVNTRMGSDDDGVWIDV